jgi:DNA-binding MarR family transcriptional regulator
MAAGFNQHFDKLGLTQAQFRVVLAVWNLGAGGGVTPSELAAYLFLERASVSVLLKKLFDKQLLAPQAGENRRSYRVTLTEQGVALLRRASPTAQSLADATFEGFAPADVQRFEEMLRTLETRLRTDAQQPR